MNEIVVFGGCFNPPLNSHFSLAQELINEHKQIEKIIFMPASSKYQKADLIGNEHRYQMIKLVCDKNDKFDVSRIEIDFPRQLHTIETLNKIKEQYPKNEICFTTGTDNLKELETLNQAQEILKNFKIYVFERGIDNVEEIIMSNEFLRKNKQAFQRVENQIKSNLSSTYARTQLKNKKSIKYLTPNEVEKYIEQNKLYN